MPQYLFKRCASTLASKIMAVNPDKIGSAFVHPDGVYVKSNDALTESEIAKVASEVELTRLKVSVDDGASTDIESALMLTSPNGTTWKIKVNNFGVLTTEAV